MLFSTRPILLRRMTGKWPTRPFDHGCRERPESAQLSRSLPVFGMRTDAPLSGPCCYRTPAAGFCCYGLGVVTRTVLRIAKAAGVKLTRGRPCRNRPPCWAPRASLTSSPVGSSDPGPAHRRHPPDLPPPVRLRRDVCKMRRAGFGWDQRCLHRREHYPRRSPPTAGNQANRGIRQDTLANTGWRSNSPGALRLRPCAG